MAKIWVKTGGRLHLGQLDLNGSLGRLYGGLGIAIDQPQLEITAEKCESISIVCHDNETKRVHRITSEYLSYYGLPGIKVELVQSLPSHSGLGSGTCLALALGFAVTRVYGLQPTLIELASVTDREGSRSGLGVAAFERGGFLVDGGRAIDFSRGVSRCQVPPLLFRFPFPEDWSIILAMPDGNRVFGQAEECSFRSLPCMDGEMSGAICRTLLMKLLPALVEKNLESFGAAVSSIQEYVGTYFSPAQGGVYASGECFRIAELLRSRGAVGVGQSSWGPVIYGFVRKESHRELLANVRDHTGDHVRVWATSGRNQGASWGWQRARELSIKSTVTGT